MSFILLSKLRELCLHTSGPTLCVWVLSSSSAMVALPFSAARFFWVNGDKKPLERASQHWIKKRNRITFYFNFVHHYFLDWRLDGNQFGFPLKPSSSLASFRPSFLQSVTFGPSPPLLFGHDKHWTFREGGRDRKGSSEHACQTDWHIIHSTSGGREEKMQKLVELGLCKVGTKEERSDHPTKNELWPRRDSD